LTLNIEIILLVHERLTKINHRFEIIKVTNADVLAILSLCHSINNILNIAITKANEISHCITLRNNVLLPNNGSDALRGFLFIIFDSSFSASNSTEHAGSMRSSRNTTCTGNNIIGRQNRIGTRLAQAIGTWTITM